MICFLQYTSSCSIRKKMTFTEEAEPLASYQFVLMVCGHGDVHVLVAFFGDDAATRSAGEEAELDEVGFIHFFDGAHFFADDSRDRLDACRTTT